MAPAVLKTLLLLFTLGLEINFVLLIENKISRGTGNLIESERNSYAAKMASYMNTKVDPCEDFYEYSCGNYFKMRKEKYGVSSTDLFSIVNSEMNEALDKLWSEPVATNITVTEKAKLFYKSCMKEDIFQFLKADAYLKLIESLGGWPALDPKWKPKNFAWQNVITTLASLGIDAFFTLTTDNIGTIVMEPPPFYGITSYLIDKPFSRNFNMNKGIIMKILSMYGVPTKKAKRVFKEIVQLGKRWRTLYNLARNHKDFDEMWTIDDLQGEVPNFNWDNYFEGILGQPINASTQLYVEKQKYLKRLPTFFTNKNARAAANYLFVKLLYGLHDELKKPQYKIDFCVETTKLAMKNVVTAIYLNSKYHQESVEDEVMSMASYMRSAFKDVIKNSDWMDRETKRKALVKLRDMRMVIGDVELSLDLASLEKDYEDLHIIPENDFYQNNLIFRRYLARVKYNALFNESYSSGDAYESDVNAFYYSGGNKMVLPAGILRKPFFMLEFPKSYNYGAMGANIIGHEMTHGFDSEGRKFDENGERNNWWSSKSDEAFQSRAECFIKQYDSYTIPEMNMKINGKQTLTENIADAGGVRQGYIAYQKWIRANEGFYMSKEILPYINMTNNQLFFLAYAQTYCSKLKREAYQDQDEDVHVVNKYRLIGSVSNYDEFGKLFNCKLGTTMNPVEKCVLW